MNELLGWYGYDHVDLRDSDSRHRAKHNHISVLKENSVPMPHAAENVPSSSSEPVRNGEREPVDTPLSSSSSSSSSVSPRIREQHNMNVVVPLIKPSAVEDVQNVQIVCVWCQKEGMKRYSLLMGSELKSFCSEKCFAACRRAYFKRNKARDEDRHDDQSPPPGQTLDTPSRLLLKMNNNTRVCDWCKHIRHTKEYLDFGSGEERLQFCSTKCLNQYKMDVFYREARAALNSSASNGAYKDEENHQNSGGGENQKLLTPESWDSSPSKTLSPKTPTSVSVLNTPSSSSALRTPVSTTQSRERSCVHTNTSASGALDQPRPPPVTLPFVRPPLHTPGLRSPAPHPPRIPPHPSSPIQRPPHPPYFAPPHPPPLLQPYPAPYVPFHPTYPPHLPPPWPQPTMLLPYPVIVPLPVPIPIPIPVSRLPGHAGVIRSPQEREEKEPGDPGHSSSEESEVQRRIKTEQAVSPLAVSLPTTSVGSSERQVIQCLHRCPIKEELQGGTASPDTPQTQTTHISHVLRKALKHHAGNVTSVVTPTASASLDNKTVTPASLYSLARSTAIQITSVSLDSTHRCDPASDVTAGSAHIPSPLSDSEDVKENSYSTNPWSAERTDCQNDQSKESMVAEDASQDVEHTYARSVPPKLREKNAHVNAQNGTQTHLHTQTYNWVPQSSETSGRDDPEPAVKRRCLRIRDQNQ